MARIAIRDTLQKRHLYNRATVMPDLFVTGVPGTSYYETRNMRVTSAGFAFDYEADEIVFVNPGWSNALDKKRVSQRFERSFADWGYCTGLREETDNRARYFSPDAPHAPEGLLAWPDRRDARIFCDAWNALIENARRRNVDDLMVFSANARNWRERPDSRPPPPPGWDRQRILAEASFRERDVFGALEHFEAGLKLYPAWPEGWFNAALLYEASAEYEYAANRMRHYLELVPDARDARAAREKLVVWEEKLRRQ